MGRQMDLLEHGLFFVDSMHEAVSEIMDLWSSNREVDVLMNLNTRTFILEISFEGSTQMDPENQHTKSRLESTDMLDP